MSPVHPSWRGVPIDLRKLISRSVGKESLPAMIDAGFAVRVRAERVLEFVKSLADLLPGDRKDAVRAHSEWHIIGSMRGSSKKNILSPSSERAVEFPHRSRNKSAPKNGWKRTRIR